jgi:hypothetical protein
MDPIVDIPLHQRYTFGPEEKIMFEVGFRIRIRHVRI